jgi:hypothetical protein
VCMGLYLNVCVCASLGALLLLALTFLRSLRLLSSFPLGLLLKAATWRKETYCRRSMVSMCAHGP